DVEGLELGLDGLVREQLLEHVAVADKSVRQLRTQVIGFEDADTQGHEGLLERQCGAPSFYQMPQARRHAWRRAPRTRTARLWPPCPAAGTAARTARRVAPPARGHGRRTAPRRTG